MLLRGFDAESSLCLAAEFQLLHNLLIDAPRPALRGTQRSGVLRCHGLGLYALRHTAQSQKCLSMTRSGFCLAAPCRVRSFLMSSPRTVSILYLSIGH